MSWKIYAEKFTLTGLYPNWIAKSIEAITFFQPFLLVNFSNLSGCNVSKEILTTFKPAFKSDGSCLVNVMPLVVIPIVFNPSKLLSLSWKKKENY